jgi:hypothetical protein
MRRERASQTLRLMGTPQQQAKNKLSNNASHGEGHVTQASHDHLRQRAGSGIGGEGRLARYVRSPPLLRQLGLQWRRANHRDPARPAPAYAQRLRLLISKEIQLDFKINFSTSSWRRS